MCVCVLAGFLGFFGAFLGAGIVMFRANLPLHCTRNAHNVERGHRKGEYEGGFKWLWRQHLTLTNINQIGGSLYPHRECTLLVIPCQHQGHSSYCIHICMFLDTKFTESFETRCKFIDPQVRIENNVIHLGT